MRGIAAWVVRKQSLNRSYKPISIQMLKTSIFCGEAQNLRHNNRLRATLRVVCGMISTTYAVLMDSFPDYCFREKGGEFGER